MASSQDVEAGRAFVTLSLRRTEYDKQVDDLEREPSRTTEAGASFDVSGDEAGAADLSAAIAKGAAFQTGSLAIAKAVGTTGVASGTAATGLSAFASTVSAALPPLAAIAAAAALVYVTLFKWDELPFIVKALMLAFVPLVIVIRAAVLAFKSIKLAVSLATLPFRLASKAVRGFFAAIRAIPGALVAVAGHMRRLAVEAGKMAARVIRSAVEMTAKVAKSAVNIAKSVASMPGNIARSTSAALQNVGSSIARIGTVAAGIKLAIVGGATLAAKSWADYGETIRRVQDDLQRFSLTAEEASIIAHVSDQTGESMERLAQDMRDGTRDFSRWRNELQQSGALMSGPGLASALALSRAYSSMKLAAVGLKNTIGAALGPTLTESANLVTGLIRGVTKWVGENKPLIVQVFKIASAVGTATAVLTALGGAISGVGAITSPFVAGMALLAGIMTAIEIKTGAGRSAWSAYGGAVRRVVGTVLADLGEMMSFSDSVIGGVTDAIMAGDLAAAVDVMWAGAKVAWTSALLEIDKLTSGTFGGIIQSLLSGQLAAAGESAMNALRQAWLTGVGFLAGVWDTVVSAADTAWTGILTGFDQVVASMKSGLADFIGWAITNVFRPLTTQLNKVPGIEISIGTLLDAQGAIQRSLRDGEAPDRAGALSDRQATRQAASDDARTAREREIEDLKRRQAELAGKGGEAAKQQQTANQKALADAIAAAEAAREAADANKLKDDDFAVSEETKSIARFSGEALGLSVGRGNNPAERTAKLNADQLAELKALKNEMIESNREIRRLIAQGGFA